MCFCILPIIPSFPNTHIVPWHLPLPKKLPFEHPLASFEHPPRPIFFLNAFLRSLGVLFDTPPFPNMLPIKIIIIIIIAFPTSFCMFSWQLYHYLTWFSTTSLAFSTHPITLFAIPSWCSHIPLTSSRVAPSSPAYPIIILVIPCHIMQLSPLSLLFHCHHFDHPQHCPSTIGEN